MAEAKYSAETLSGSTHRFGGHQFVVQECSFDGHPPRQTRASLTNPDFGGKYTFTTALTDVWENAHYHEAQSETYVLESGEVILVVKEGQMALARQLVPGEAVTLRGGVHHKVWMKQGARLHALKAAAERRDAMAFTPSPELEDLCDAAGLERLLANARAELRTDG